MWNIFRSRAGSRASPRESALCSKETKHLWVTCASAIAHYCRQVHVAMPTFFELMFCFFRLQELQLLGSQPVDDLKVSIQIASTEEDCGIRHSLTAYLCCISFRPAMLHTQLPSWQHSVAHCLLLACLTSWLCCHDLPLLL